MTYFKKFVSQCLLIASCIGLSSLAYGDTIAATKTVVKNNPATSMNKNQIPNFLTGTVLAVDMNDDDIISKATVLKGVDLILVKVDSAVEKIHPEHINLIVSTVHPDDLAKLNVAKDGAINAEDFNLTNLALIRLDTDATLTLAPLATAHIKQILFNTNATQKESGSHYANIQLVSEKGRKFKAYYLDMAK